MISLRGPKLKIFAAVLAVIALAGGIYFTFFESRGFVKTTATIVDLEVNFGAADESDTYTPTVEYTVDGKTYTGKLNQSSSSYKVGKTITVLYDPIVTLLAFARSGASDDRGGSRGALLGTLRKS